MPPAPDVRPVPRLFLERVSRPLLVRLLAPHTSVLEQHGVPLAALAASAQTDRAHVETLWRVLGSAPADLAPLRDELVSVADVATPAGQEHLLATDTARALDHELGAEDCAAIAYLDHRELFDRTRPRAAGQSQTRAFASFQSASPKALSEDASCGVTFDQRMSADLLARGRTSYFKRHEWRSGAERHMELVYGRLATARDLLGKTQSGGTHDVTAQVTDRTTERAHLVFHDDTLRLEVAGHDWMKELVRRVFGEAYFGSADHFEGDETVSLAPLADLATALSPDGIPDLAKVELQEVCVDLGGDEPGWVVVGAKNDCARGAPAGYSLRALVDGKPIEATFFLSVTLRIRPQKIKVKLCAPRRIEFNRRDPRVARIVRDWGVGRGFMTVPEHLRDPEPEPEGESARETEVS